MDKLAATKVLIVDDNVEQTNLMRHGLHFHELSFEPEFVTSFAAALDCLAEEPPDILISELFLSDGDAMQLIADDPEAARYPVVVFTDRGSEKDAVLALKSGVLDYVVKTRRKCQEVGDLIKKSLSSWSKIRSIRKAEVNLQQTLRLARSIMDSLPDPIGVLDDQGVLLSVNDAWNRELPSTYFFDSGCQVNSDYLAYCRSSENPLGSLFAEEIVRVIQEQVSIEPIVYPVSENDDTWYSFTVHPCHGSGRARAIVIHQDVSDRKRLENHYSEQEKATREIRSLTPRERQVMNLVVGGKPNKSIARSLEISVKTVEMHRSNLMKKLRLRNVTELVRMAVSAGTVVAPQEAVSD